MYKKIYLLIISLISYTAIMAQDSPSINTNKIMLKLAKNHRHLSKGNSINNADFNSFVSTLDNVSLEATFPKHNSPREIINAHGDSLIDLSLWYSLSFDSEIPYQKTLISLKSIGIFEYVEYRAVNKLFYIPSDPKIGFQYYLDNIKAYQAWDIEQGDTNVVVAITDTGIDKLQEDLIDGIKYNYNDTIDGIDNDNDGFIDNFCGWDMASNDNNVQYGTIGHGTFVSGFVSAVPDNNIGIAGVGYHTKILPVRVDNSDGALSADYEGIVYAADHGASIINCSWGGPFGGDFGRDVINYATYNRGALIVAACGNSNNPYWFYPASYENVLSCAATDTFDVRWANSSYGTTVDLSAPGTFVYSTWINNGYFSSHGTSFSAPIIAGGAALVKAHFPWMTNMQIAEQLRVTADNIDTIAANSSTIGMMGAGRLNIYRALTDTLKPSIRFINKNITISNDTLYISGDFINYLTTSSLDLRVKFSTNSMYLSPIKDSMYLEIIPTYSVKSISSTPIKFKIIANAPIDSYAEIKITYIDTAYTGFEWVRVYLKNQIATLDTNNITTSINSVSTIGFNDGAKELGKGFIYKNGRNLLSWGGLLIATASSKVSDNLFGASGYEDKFVAISQPQLIANPSPANQKYLSIFNDDNAGFSKNKIQVNQYSYAFSQDPLKDIIFLEYNIINKNFSAINNVNVAFYADYDIGLSYKNKAKYDSTLNMAYTWPTQGGTFAGIKLMSRNNTVCYNFNNNGSEGSINIYDGFLNFEKWNAMHTSRNHAGLSTDGTDVSSMLALGPYTIAANDTLKLTFALLAGSTENEIKNTAIAADYWFYNTASINSLKQNLGAILLQNIPNPASNKTDITFIMNKPDNIKLEVFNIEGKHIETIVSGNLSAGKHIFSLNLNKYNSGIYTYKLTTTKGSLSRKMIIK